MKALKRGKNISLNGGDCIRTICVYCCYCVLGKYVFVLYLLVFIFKCILNTFKSVNVGKLHFSKI